MTSSVPSSTSKRFLPLLVGVVVLLGVSYGIYTTSGTPPVTPQPVAPLVDDRIILQMQVLQKGVGGAINEIKGEGPAARQTLYISVQDVPPTLTNPAEQVVLLAGEEGGTPSFVSSPNEDDVNVAAPVSWLYSPSATAKRIKFCLAAGHNPEEIKANMIKTQDVWKQVDAKGCRSVEVSD